jgi:hypothetical protein
MSIVEKVVRACFSIILPQKAYATFVHRMNITKEILNSSKILRVFWFIVFLPLVLGASLLTAFVKLTVVWLLGPSVYSNTKYALNMFYNDLTSTTKRKPLRIAIKRVQLFHELIVKGKEKKVSYGEENPDKTFLVIRPYYFMTPNEINDKIVHLLFNYYRNLHFVAYAIEKGWIPVVDWENYGILPHMENFPIHGTKNGWEYYWKQPSEYTLDEVYRSKNVVLCYQNVLESNYIPSNFFKPPLQNQALNYARKCPKYDNYISLNEPTSQYIEEKQKALFPHNARIMGVSVRGTSYGNSEISKHPIQPGHFELVNSINNYLREWDMEYIFFACESEDLVNVIKKEFGSKVLIMPRMRYKTLPTKDDNPLYAPGQRYQTNLDYLAEMTLLSRCDSLLAAMSGGVRAAIIWNANRYEHMKILENGLWK